MANITWIGSPNYWAGRTQKVSKIVIHWMAGSLASTDKVFQDTNRETSAHFGIEDKTVHQYVKTDDTAWHARQANPYTIGIEHSAAPGRLASDDTYTTSIELIAGLCKQYGLDETAIVKHSDYVATQCPGTMDIDRIKAGVKAALKGTVAPVVTPPVTTHPSIPVATNVSGTLRLPASATTWRVYPPEGAYTIGHEVGMLTPSVYGGLTYDILGNPAANIYLIQTGSYGKVAIYAAPDTGATVNVSGQGTDKGDGGGKTVYLPSTPTWRVYKESGPYSVGNEIGYLAPANYGGLSYAVLGNPAQDVVLIQTQSFGKVAIYVAASTGAIIK